MTSRTVNISVEEYEAFNSMVSLMAQLQDKVDRLEASSVSPSAGVREPRMSDPEFFNGTRLETRNFLTQVRMVISANPSRFPTEKAKILYACSYLRGPAFTWVQPFLLNEHSPNLSSFEVFARSLTAQFGDRDEKATAERDIYLLKQTTSVSVYATEFLKFSGFLQWNDAALCSQFYRNLKPRIKDELCTIERPGDLKKLIDICIRIDNRMYDRFLERQVEPARSPPTPNNSRGQIYDNRVVPMEIDSMSSKPSFKKVSPEEKARRKKLNLCAYCGETTHLIDSCPKKPKNNLPENLKSGARRI